MNSLYLLLGGLALLGLGYFVYGAWLEKVWGVDPSRPTPAHQFRDGVDYMPSKAPVVLGHHFSSIAGAGPINGPIQAAVFGWLPCFIWVVVGGIFFGGVHDFGSLFASLRNKGRSIGEVIAGSIGLRAKRLFVIFSFLTLVLVVAAFASIVASTFQATYVDGVLIVNKSYSLPEDYNPGLDATTEEAFNQLSADAAQEGLNLYIGSDFRSYSYQVDVYESYCETYGWQQADTFSARPGYSEHQTGLTIDCNTIDDAFGQTEEAVWLADHCADYGFIVRFPDGKEDITGYQYEPWHIRYVGVDIAREIMSKGLCLEEYLGVDSVYAGAWEH